MRIPIRDGRCVCVYSVYLPAQGSAEDFDTIIDEVHEIVCDSASKDIAIICGDFNGDVGFLGGLRSTRSPSRQGKRVAQFFKELSLYPANLDPLATGPINTFKGGMGSSTLDYVAVPLSLKQDVISCRVVDNNILNTSDHFAIEVNLRIQCGVCHGYKNKIPGRILWDKAKNSECIQQFRYKIGEVVQNINGRWNISTCSKEQIDHIFSVLTKGILESDKHLPRSKFKNHTRPFWNQVLSTLKKDKVIAYRRWKREGSPRDLDNDAWCAYKETKKAFRREVKRVQRNHEQKEIWNLVDAAGTNRNKFWKLLKRKRNTVQSELISIKSQTGGTVYEIKEVVSVWGEHFRKLCDIDKKSISDEAHHNMVTKQVAKWRDEKDNGTIFEESLTHDEINTAIKTLNSGKSPGFDLISSEHLKYASRELVEILTRCTYNRVITIEYIPKNFRIGTQIPLFKGKNLCSLEPNNYRGITLLTNF